MSDSDQAETAILSMGGLSWHGQQAGLSLFDQLVIGNDKIVMPGATKASLGGMPGCHYTNA